MVGNDDQGGQGGDRDNDDAGNTDGFKIVEEESKKALEEMRQKEKYKSLQKSDEKTEDLFQVPEAPKADPDALSRE